MKGWMLATLVVAGSLVCPRGGEAMSFGRVAPLTSTAATDGAANDQYPALATDGQGKWVAAWASSSGGGLGITGDGAPVYSRSVDDGVTWSPAALVRPEAAGHSNAQPTVATDGNGKWILVWGAGTNELRATVSADNGQTWGTPTVLVSDSPGENFAASLDTDRAGTWVVAWTTNGGLGGAVGQDFDILYSRSIDGGLVWSAPAALNTTAATDDGADFDVRIVTDRTGVWVAVWSAFAQTMYARSTDNGQTWSAPAALSHIGFQAGAHPDVTTDRTGRWIAVWSISNDGVGGFDDDDIWVSSSSDNGITWSAESRLHPYMDSDKIADGTPRIVSSSDDLWSVVWVSQDSLHGHDLDVEISTSRDEGLSWSAPAALVSRATTDGAATDLWPQIVSSPTGQALVVWTSEDSLDDTIGTDFDIVFAAARRDCSSTAREDCRAGNRSHALTIRDKEGGADLLKWSWRSSENTSASDLGDPTAGDSYVACLYEKAGGAPALIGEWDAVAGSHCGSLDCWSKGSGYVAYSDAKKENGSLKRLKVRAPATSASTVIRLQANGATLAPPRLPLDVSTPVRFQLVNLGTGVCWEGVYDQATTNDPQKFVSKSD